MLEYEVIITDNAQNQLEEYLSYILHSFKSQQAAEAVWNDAMETKEKLVTIAGSIKEMDNPVFKGYKRINFSRHRYAMIFRVEGNTAYIERVFHQLEDIDNKFI